MIDDDLTLATATASAPPAARRPDHAPFGAHLIRLGAAIVNLDAWTFGSASWESPGAGSGARVLRVHFRPDRRAALGSLAVDLEGEAATRCWALLARDARDVLAESEVPHA